MKKIFIIIGLISVIFFSIDPASAQLLNSPEKLKDLTDEMATTAQLGDIPLSILIANIIKIALGFLALIFVVLMVVAGFQWMTAAGNEEQAKKAMGIIKTAVIGLVIVLAAYAITYFIFTYLPFSGGAPQGGSSDPI